MPTRIRRRIKVNSGDRERKNRPKTPHCDHNRVREHARRPRQRQGDTRFVPLAFRLVAVCSVYEHGAVLFPKLLALAAGRKIIGSRHDERSRDGHSRDGIRSREAAMTTTKNRRTTRSTARRKSRIPIPRVHRDRIEMKKNLRGEALSALPFPSPSF